MLVLAVWGAWGRVTVREAGEDGCLRGSGAVVLSGLDVKMRTYVP